MDNGLTKVMEKISEQYACITKEDAAFMLLEHNPSTRLLPVIVRCGGRRFRCALQDLEVMIRAVENDGDYIRDVSAAPTNPRWVDLGLNLERYRL